MPGVERGRGMPSWVKEGRRGVALARLGIVSNRAKIVIMWVMWKGYENISVFVNV